MNRIWKSPQTHYLIPTSLEWEDESELAAFAVSEEEAQEHLKNEMQVALSQVKTAWTNWKAAQQPIQLDPSAKDKAMVKDILGITADELKADPTAGERVINDFFGGLKTFIQSVTEQDGSVAKAQMATLQTKLEKHGVVTDETDLTTLPETLRQAYQKVQEKKAADFMQLADQLDEAVVDVSAALRTYARTQMDSANHTNDQFVVKSFDSQITRER
jgi:cobalamin biosynthesis protein CbiD